MAERERIVQEGEGSAAQFFRETVRSPRPGSQVTIVATVAQGEGVGRDLDNIPVAVGSHAFSVPASAIKECVTRVAIEAPKRADTEA